MVTGDHSGFIKYWQSNMNNVKAFQAHKEAVRDIRYEFLSFTFKYLYFFLDFPNILIKIILFVILSVLFCFSLTFIIAFHQRTRSLCRVLMMSH